MKDATAKTDGHVAPESLYDRDYYAWVQKQVEALRRRRPEALDWEYLREEVEDLGKHERRELTSRLQMILVHLLKWQFQSRKRSRSWEGTLVEQRLNAKELLSENPSLKPQMVELTARAYQLARPTAASEMGLGKREWQRLFPAACPWSPEQVLDEDFLPATPPARPRSR